MSAFPYKGVKIKGRCTTEHVLIAERVLGRRLPEGALVHHVDGNKLNNANSNLVICPSDSYHRLIHMREKALIATGDPSKLPCHICGKWDLRENLYFRKSWYGQWHRACANKKREARRKRKMK